jgi:hypothetical protein
VNLHRVPGVELREAHRIIARTGDELRITDAPERKSI